MKTVAWDPDLGKIIERDMTADELESLEQIQSVFDPVETVASVSARQFKLQLLASGLLDQVDAWIASQSKAVQIAYEYSGTFVKSEPMMQAGFTALGFTDQQLDDFFEAASKI
jgi:hypothetical protein